MQRFLVLCLAAVVFIAGGHASAEEAAPRRRAIELALSSGYSSGGFGHYPPAPGFETLWAVPLLLDVDYRVSKHWSFGVYGEVGFIHNGAPDVANADETVNGHHYRFGVAALYHSAPERKVQPWLGVGLGFDALRATYRVRSTLPPRGNAPPDPGSSSPIRTTGFEVGHAQLGIEFALVPAFAFGPFLGASVVAYGKRRSIANSDTFNVWSNIGLKATLRL